jgi:hypothetical protein
MISSALLAVGLSLGAGYYSSTEADAMFSAANEAYGSEDYAKAKDGYLKLLQHGYGGPDVLYNLGTSSLAAGDIGEAVLYLERARRESGRDEDIESNLQLARARQLDQVVGANVDEPFVERVALAVPETVATIAFSVAWGLAFATLALARLVRGGGRSAAWAICALAFAAAVPTGGIVASHVYLRRALREAVVVAYALPARDIPREAGKVAFEVHAGLKVRIIDESGKFFRIRLPNGLEGWADREGVRSL